MTAVKLSKFMVELEYATGEGMIVELVLPADFPIFTRMYAPFEPDELGLNWAECVRDAINKEYGEGYWEFFSEEDEDGPVSVSAIPSLQRTKAYQGLTLEEAKVKAEELEETVRVVREDGKAYSVGVDVQPEGRVNLFLAKGKVYRAEYF